ncbi:cytosolic carboxypeptidase 2-like [Plakobranchus ocellatus]|uniref:Cytosolic carboxypeptidase 2-like n=1 Tax=Plakobranchus ocellatus TaxID=259542 RepID=A0AAV4AZ33_9GAST|nr:cytosolic carboxypeptidase 2-like [Plakobranchus ocellatus]
MVSLYRSWSLVQQRTNRTDNRDYHLNHQHHHAPPHLRLFRSHTRASSQESFAFSFASDPACEGLRSPSPLHVSQLSYSDQLEDYIIRYKRRPPDIKYWPYGPYWPRHFDGLLLNTPRHLWSAPREPEPLATAAFGRRLHAVSRTIDNQATPYKGKWRGVQVAFDSERSSRDFSPLPVPEGCCPSLVFESRFECGNLRQARRVGQFEYELVLKPDLYTLRHTQWYYFRVNNAVPGVTYKLRIVNLLKRDSLYNHGMRPLLYSENDAQEKQRGWVRTGHHISYSRNFINHNCPLLQRGVTYHMLEWQMEFHNSEDTYYLAHCYPYSFTDLKEDLDVLMNSEERAQVTRRQVLCETRAGNSCFVITVTNFACKEEKKGIVISGRVHPGESQASWVMKGLLEFLTGPDPEAQELRNKFIFKIVPMVNPDGVIVGNYRCSLAARDLNRNYRHPRRENFPVIWHIKNMVEELAKTCEIALYCDLHGHSRKPNVFMYGNNTSTEAENTPVGPARAFISERLFPWLMGLRSPEKFHFKSCKFQIRRCKESTGRVVMWRQMKIFNSFTLEATFSGTVVNKESCRHFNILDFMEMGKVLAQTVLDYHKAQDDHTAQTQAVLGLTKVITEQILASKGLIEPDATLQDFSNTDPANLEATEAAKVQESAEKWTGALLALLNTPRDSTVAKDAGAVTGGNGNQAEERGGGGSMRADNGSNIKAGAEADQRPVFTRDDVVQMLENLSGGRSMEDCLSFLSEIGVQDAIIDESDSSDSDSESEPEMKPPEPKTRKKKRKSKKQRDKDNEKKVSVGEKRNSEEPRLKALSATSCPDKNRVNRQMSSFISKYEGRHNGGVPCFTEERSMERAAKRLAELRRKMDDSSNGRDLTFYCVDEAGMHPTTSEDFSHRLQELGEANPTIAATLLGLNVRTGYTHAENLQDSNPNANAHLGGAVSPYLMSTFSTQGFRPEPADLLEQSSSDSCDNSDVDSNNNKIMGLPTTRIGNSIVKSTINHNSASTTTSINNSSNINITTGHARANSFDMKSLRTQHCSPNKDLGVWPSWVAQREESDRSYVSTNDNKSYSDTARRDRLDFHGVISGFDVNGAKSLPVTARKSPYVQLEPLLQRSSSTLSFFKHSQGLSDLPSQSTSTSTTTPAAASPKSRHTPEETSKSAFSKTAILSTQRASCLNNRDTRGVSSSRSLHVFQKSSSPLISGTNQPRAYTLGSLRSTLSLDQSSSDAATCKTLSLKQSPDDTSCDINGMSFNRGLPHKVVSKHRPDNPAVSRQRSHETPCFYGLPATDGSSTPSNVYTYFAVYGSMPCLNISNTKDKRHYSQITNQNIVSSNHDDKAEQVCNVDRLVNSLAQNLTAVTPTSGSTVARRHARYKTTHLRSMSRTGASSSSPLLGSGCLPTHTNRLVLPDSLNSLTAAAPRAEEKGRTPGGRNSNLSLRGPSHTPNALHSPGYTWD